jgi:hypothetical protein
MAEYGVDRSVSRTAPPSTTLLGMQQRLFGSHMEGLAPVSDAEMAGVLCDLRGASALESFRLWHVGSRVEPGRDGSDIDVVLSPQPGTMPSDHLIERALWYCREYGFYGATPRCVIDPSFRALGPTVALAPLPPRAAIRTIKLFSPRLASLLRQGRIAECRRVGDVCIAFVRPAEDTGYYRKLPRRHFDGDSSPYLRPAIEISAMGGDVSPHHASIPMRQRESVPRRF